MSSVESSKTLADVGVLLLFLSFIPLLGIVGLILVGMKGLVATTKMKAYTRTL